MIPLGRNVSEACIISWFFRWSRQTFGCLSIKCIYGRIEGETELKIVCKGIADIKIRRLSVSEATKVKYQIVLCACWDGHVRILALKNPALACLAYHDGSIYNLCLPRPDAEAQRNGELLVKLLKKVFL